MDWKRLLALTLAVPLLFAGSVGADDAEQTGEGDPAPHARLFPYGVRVPGPADSDVAHAVSTGLRWLAAHQSESGLWQAANLGWCDGKKGRADLKGKGKALYDPGVTGMAVCAFLAAGHAHQGGTTYSAVVAKALAALVAVQDPEGCVGPRSSQHYVYNHAFGALALVEAFGETGDVRLLGPARKALAFSARARNPGFAWRYGIRPRDNDTSITGCMLVPFYAARRVNRAAEAAGLEPPFAIDPATYEGARAWIDRMTDPDYGRTGYIQKGGCPARPKELVDEFPGDLSESCTAIGVFLRAVLPGGDENADAVFLQKGTRLLYGCLPRWTPGGGNIDLYYWYYGALAMDAVGGGVARAWQKALEGALVGGQRKDTDPCAYAGSWDTDGPWGADGGRAYTTAMAVLCLRTPQRYPRLPPDRSDLATALAGGTLDPHTTVRVLRAVAAYRTASAGAVLLPYAASTDPRVRAAAAAALASCDPSEQAVHTLGELLGDASVEVRREAAAGLAPLGRRCEPVAEAIVGALDDADAGVRRHALHALARLPDAISGSTSRLRTLLADPAPRVSIAAAGILRRLETSDAEAEALLLAGLELADEVARAETATALGDADPTSDAVRKALEQRLGDASPRVRVAAARGLAATGTDPAVMLEIVASCFGSKDLETRRLALELVERLGPAGGPVAEQVAEAALSGAVPLRVAAVRALAAMGTEVEGAVAVLYAVQGRGPVLVRDAAREGLERIDAQGEALVQALIPGLGSPHREVVTGAVLGLGQQGRDAVEPLLAVLARGKPNEQVAALRALTRIGPKAGAAVSDVEELLDRGGPPALLAQAALFLGSVGRRARGAIEGLARLAEQGPSEARRAAIQALGSLGDVEGKAVEALGRLANRRAKEDRAARIEVLRALARLGPKAEPALSALRLALSTTDPDVRAAAVEALAAVGKPAVPHLLRAMRDVDTAYVRAAIEALGKMGPDAKKAVPKLAEALPAAARVRDWRPARALAGIGKPSVRALIALCKEGRTATKVQAAWALGRIGKDAKSAVSTLRRLVKDDDPQVRVTAQKALENIRDK